MGSIVCSCGCGLVKASQPRADGEVKLPKGWKQFGDRIYAPPCVRRCFKLRSLGFTVASVVCGFEGESWSVQECTRGRQTFHQALARSQADCRRAYNLALVELAKADSKPLEPGPKGPKLPKFSATDVNLYPLGRTLFPDLDSQSLGSLLVKVRSKYLEKRFERRVLGRTTLPEQTRVPLPIPSKDAKVTVSDQHQPFVRVRIHGERFTLRLRNTPNRPHHNFYRQVAALERVLAGEGSYGEVVLDRRRDGTIACRVLVYLPMEKIERTDRKIIVRTCKDRLWSVQIDEREEAFVLNNDQIRKRISRHLIRLHRLSQDQKFERRLPEGERTGINGYRETICNKQNHWLNDVCHKASAMLAGLVILVGAGTVEYDDTETGFAESFPLFRLRSLCQQKVEAKGGTFVHANGSAESTAE